MGKHKLMEAGEVHVNNQGLSAVVIEYIKASKVRIRFDDGAERFASAYDIRHGIFRHPNFKKKEKPCTRVVSKFEEIMSNWQGDTDQVGIKKLPIFKGIVGREEICGETLVDEWIYEKYKNVMWTLTSTGYVSCKFSIRNCERMGIDHYEGMSSNGVHLHRAVVGLGDNTTGLFHADHINHDKLDNRFCNLRVATNGQNVMNARKNKGSSKYKGVYFDKRFIDKNPWKSTITCNGKMEHLGYHEDELDAARAYDKRARELFGEFALLNFSDM